MTREVRIDKNGKRFSFEYGRHLPSFKGSATDRLNRELILKIRETVVLCDSSTTGIKWHGARCDSCANWATCKNEIGAASASANYCTRPKRGYKRPGAPEPWPQQQDLPPRRNA